MTDQTPAAPKVTGVAPQATPTVDSIMRGLDPSHAKRWCLAADNGGCACKGCANFALMRHGYTKADFDAWHATPAAPQGEDDRAAFEAWFEGATIELLGCDWMLAAWQAALAAERAKPNPWREVIDESLVGAGLDVASDDPASDLLRLLDWHHDIWLDPAVCQEAQALIDRGAAEERAKSAPSSSTEKL
jgi:hypothetical protein